MFLCIGDIDVDILISVDRLPTRDGKVNGELIQRVPGGMAGNVATALTRLGAQVRVLGRVGDDADGVFALAELARAGIDTRFVTRIIDTKTFSCIGLITPDGEKSLVKLMTAAYRAEVEDLLPPVFEGVAHVHLTSVGDIRLCRRVVELATGRGATASIDVELADVPRDPSALVEALRGFDLLFCNSESRLSLDGLLEPDLRTLVPVIVTTLGAAGARLEEASMTVEARGYSATVKDTTGAGDCFAAACLHARLVQGLDWAAALRFANRAAALSTEGYGAQSALPTYDEVLRALTV
jgi:sugar/nucleoside kinase (ribokinase family)